jgi:hypothetical protein
VKAARALKLAEPFHCDRIPLDLEAVLKTCCRFGFDRFPFPITRTYVSGQAGTPWTFLNLIARRLAVFAGLAGADIDALIIVHLHFNGLITAVAADIETHVVSFFA